jgi:hypothetical protein
LSDGLSGKTFDQLSDGLSGKTFDHLSDCLSDKPFVQSSGGSGSCASQMSSQSDSSRALSFDQWNVTNSDLMTSPDMELIVQSSGSFALA